MSVCLTFENSRDCPGTEFRSAVSKLGKKTEIRACVFTFTVELEKWSSFRVADFSANGKEMSRNKNST